MNPTVTTTSTGTALEWIHIPTQQLSSVPLDYVMIFIVGVVLGYWVAYTTAKGAIQSLTVMATARI